LLKIAKFVIEREYPITTGAVQELGAPGEKSRGEATAR
jgi:hypothetical protein